MIPVIHGNVAKFYNLAVTLRCIKNTRLISSSAFIFIKFYLQILIIIHIQNFCNPLNNSLFVNPF